VNVCGYQIGITIDPIWCQHKPFFRRIKSPWLTIYRVHRLRLSITRYKA
jgi:hypothetical protein